MPYLRRPQWESSSGIYVWLLNRGEAVPSDSSSQGERRKASAGSSRPAHAETETETDRRFVGGRRNSMPMRDRAGLI